jgi:hypothetical protein
MEAALFFEGTLLSRLFKFYRQFLKKEKNVKTALKTKKNFNVGTKTTLLGALFPEIVR